MPFLIPDSFQFDAAGVRYSFDCCCAILFRRFESLAREPDPLWNSLFIAPRFQEYMSNHAVITTAVMHTLAGLIGDEQTFTLAAPGYPNFTWTFNRFSDAVAQVKEARIWAGIHFRNSCDVGEQQGIALSNYILANFMRPLADEESLDAQ